MRLAVSTHLLYIFTNIASATSNNNWATLVPYCISTIEVSLIIIQCNPQWEINITVSLTNYPILYLWNIINLHPFFISDCMSTCQRNCKSKLYRLGYTGPNDSLCRISCTNPCRTGRKATWPWHATTRWHSTNLRWFVGIASFWTINSWNIKSVLV